MPLRLSATWNALPRCGNHSRAAIPPFRLLASTRFESTVPSRSPTSPAPAPAPAPVPASKDVEVEPDSPAYTRSANHERNAMFKDAFRAKGEDIAAAVESTLASAYVPDARRYPDEKPTRRSLTEVKAAARRQVGFEKLAVIYNSWVPTWQETCGLLRNMTVEKRAGPTMTALRIVLPKSWDLSLSSERVDFVRSSTGLMGKLRMSADQTNPSAIILRGQSSVLASAADEMLAACKDIEIFQLGEVALSDYEVKRLWPVIEGAADGGSSLPDHLPDSIWAHKEHTTYWIEKPYEDTPKPKIWTKGNFETYITTLVCGRLRPDLVLKHYGGESGQPNRKLVDTDGIRVSLITQAFQDPSAASCITSKSLKMTLEFMSQRGGHRAAADSLFTMAEGLGLPMDTDTFNIILHGYVTKRDVAKFHQFLRKTESRYFHPNARTWLLFLQLIEKDDVRRQIIVIMYQTGMFEDPVARRSVAKVMAAHDAYFAFKSGLTLPAFMAEMDGRYGEKWLTPETRVAILAEFFNFHNEDYRRYNDFRDLVESQTGDGRGVDIQSLNLVLHKAAAQRDWPTALWALERFGAPGSDFEPNDMTYFHLLRLAILTRAQHALAITFFYAVVYRKLRVPSRELMGRIFTGRHWDTWYQTPSNQPPVFTPLMAQTLKAAPVRWESGAVEGAEWAILRRTKGGLPRKLLWFALEAAWRTMDRPMHYRPVQPALAMSLKKRHGGIAIKTILPEGPSQTNQPKRRYIHRLLHPFDVETMVNDDGHKDADKTLRIKQELEKWEEQMDKLLQEGVTKAGLPSPRTSRAKPRTKSPRAKRLRAKLLRAKLLRAKPSPASLARASRVRARFARASLSRAKLLRERRSEEELFEAIASPAKPSPAEELPPKPCGIKRPRSQFSRAKLSRAKFLRAERSRTGLFGVKLSPAEGLPPDPSRANRHRANLSRAYFLRAERSQISLYGAKRSREKRAPAKQRSLTGSITARILELLNNM